ncbi:MAG TPA: DUF3604 domain-containing protein [Bryobacterales bacterium]|nr:DUF3604 domain-containing protein [Bryobacterales bacterium]
MRAWVAMAIAAVGLAAMAGRMQPRAEPGPQQRPRGARKKAQAAQAESEAGEGNFDLRSPDLAPATLAGEVPAARISDPAMTADWPAVAAASDRALWTIYVQWNGKDRDQVLVERRRSVGENSPAAEPIPLNDGSGDHYSPAIVALPGGAALAVWSGQVDQGKPGGNFELFAARISANGKPGKVERLTHAAFSDFNARAAADAKGNVTVVWQSFRNGESDIYARRRSASGRWGPEARVSPSIADDWEPAVALDSRGTAWISWDSYQAGNYDVFLASFDGARASAPIPITGEPAAQFHSSVAVDGRDRVWVAWDEAGENWGKDFSRASSAPGSRGLHYSRTLNLRVWDGSRVLAPAADLQKVLTGRMARYAELPHLAFDGAGGLWMVFRHWTLPHPTEIYHFYATRLGPEGWSTPVRLAESSGQNTQHAGITIVPDGSLRVVYSSDGRSPTHLPTDQAHALHYNVYLASLAKGEPVSTQLEPVSVTPPASAFAARRRATMQAGGKIYTLLLGDSHRHTDIRGHSGVDGSVLDTYRYAMDAAQLDWLGTSDHNEVVGGSWPDGVRDYQWWTVQKTVDLMSHPPSFIPVYSYEHSMMRPAGHRNMLFLKRGAPLRMIDRRHGRQAPDNAPPALWDWVEKNVLTQSGQKIVIVPHTFAAGPLADWNWPNARFDCLLEIYQGCRGSYEAWRLPPDQKRGPTQTDEPGHFAQDALARGNVYGFVSFSDHGSTHNSWAAVWSEAPTREALFDAMLARRTYAASDEIIVKTTAGGHMPGEQFTASAATPPEITASIEAPDAILRIDVVKDGKYIFTESPGSRTATIHFRDAGARPGQTYYYIRVFQRDPDNPSGYPEIAWTSPFYVTYQ